MLKILLVVVAVVAVFVGVVLTRPAAYHVERKVDVEAPPAVVFPLLNDLRAFAHAFVLFGATYEQLTPDVQKTFAGPDAGVGQSYAWAGKDVGTGSLVVVDSVAGQKVGMKLVFVEPMASTAAVTLSASPTPAGSSVTWSMQGEHNFIGKAFGLFIDMDALLAVDVEKGLAELKTIAEKTTAPAATTAEATPAAILAVIEQLKSAPVENPPARVVSYSYRGGVVFYVPPHCCDVPSTLLDGAGQKLCSPDGGMTGRGDGKCSDFFETRTNERVLWSDTRTK